MKPNRSNTDEIESLYVQYGPGLVLFATTITGDRAGAQDAVQRVFVRLIENNNLHQAADKKSYLFACVRNAVFNDVKVRSRDTTLDPDTVWFNPPKRDYTAELNLRRALKGLPEDQREVVVLHVWCELTFSQISDLLSISSNTAASRYRYAVGRLREAMCPKENPCASPR